MGTTFRHIHAGDHCRIQIRSAREDWCDLEHIESLSRRQRIILSSPEDHGEDEGLHEEDTISRSRSTTTTRSRSRGRQRGLYVLQTHVVRLQPAAAIVNETIGSRSRRVFEGVGMITGCRNGTADLSISQTHARLLTARAQMEEMITGRDGKTIWLEEPHHLVPFVDAFARLSPPGNGSHTGSDLDVLDDWTWSGDTVIVKDYSDQRCSLDARSAPSQTVEDSTDRAHPVTCNPAAGANMLQVEGPLWSTYGALVYGDAAHNVDLPTLEWHPETTLLMSQWLTTQLGAFEKFIIYTDGSAGSQREGTEQVMKAHWAYAVWALVSEQRQLIHFDRGHVVTDHNDEGWHGTLRATSLEAERAALIAASVWANRDLAAYRLPIEFCFDNVAAGFGSSGQWKIQRSQSDAILLRCMMQTLEERLGQQPVFIHVHAHTGDAYNEFVDTLAYDALKKNVLGAPIDFDVREVLKGDHPECAHWPLLARNHTADNNDACILQQWDYLELPDEYAQSRGCMA